MIGIDDLCITNSEKSNGAVNLNKADTKKYLK